MTTVTDTTSVETVTFNQTITTTVTTPIFGEYDITSVILTVVAVAALVIALYALSKRSRSRPATPAAPAVTRVIICPSCRASNKPGAAFCRKCRTQLR